MPTPQTRPPTDPVSARGDLAMVTLERAIALLALGAVILLAVAR
jgi:hypothetical protein